MTIVVLYHHVSNQELEEYFEQAKENLIWEPEAKPEDSETFQTEENPKTFAWNGK